ncbi:hypothetical protein [uncultured Bdellovibrio sp.]|uniref:hypothetical protein n=1 Tax=Bdellovibrio sp. HCB-162 TaxID=3394234 RepID=UPI0025F4A594|nr:hypothetical protein [uncultured Bdellovibrio sp.]
MRTALLVALLLIVPHLVQGVPYTDKMQVNGESSAATRIIERKEKQEMIKQQTQREPASDMKKEDPSLVPCPAGQQVREGKLRDLAKVENHSTTCPGDGELPDHPSTHNMDNPYMDNKSGTPIDVE